MERIGDEVARALRKSGGGAGESLAEITRAWPEAVGPAVARQAWPARVGRDGALHVTTSSATWAFELDRLAPEIGARLASILGDRAPASLRFRVGPVPEPGRPEEPASPHAAASPPVPPETAAAATRLSEGIEDPELRELVARAARASLARAGVRPPFLID